MLGLSMESSPAFKYSQERHLEWPTAASLRAWSLMRWFSFDPARPISIIDPEGKVLATGLTPAQAKAELEKALAQ